MCSATTWTNQVGYIIITAYIVAMGFMVNDKFIRVQHR